MSFARLPDSMARYATHELAELLRTLTPQQRAAVGRIVEHVYISNRPWAHLFDGDDKICSETTYYRRGILDPETGEWSRQGWNHQPDFRRAVEMAARLALQAEENEGLRAVRTAVRRSRLAAPLVVGELVRLARLAERDQDRIRAGTEVLGVALRHTEFAEGESNSAADDWWQAVDDD